MAVALFFKFNETPLCHRFSTGDELKYVTEECLRGLFLPCAMKKRIAFMFNVVIMF